MFVFCVLSDKWTQRSKKTCIWNYSERCSSLWSPWKRSWFKGKEKVILSFNVNALRIVSVHIPKTTLTISVWIFMVLRSKSHNNRQRVLDPEAPLNGTKTFIGETWCKVLTCSDVYFDIPKIPYFTPHWLLTEIGLEGYAWKNFFCLFLHKTLLCCISNCSAWRDNSYSGISLFF